MGLQTINGYTTADGDRVVVTGQTIQSQNGIYVASAGAWSRSADADSWNELIQAYVFIAGASSSYVNTTWVCNIAPGGTLGTDAVTWVQFSAIAAYSAGNGLQLTGTQFSILTDGTSLSTSGSGVRIAATYAGQTSITTLGAIAAGTWMASIVGTAYGGLGSSGITGLIKGTAGTPYTYASASPVTTTVNMGDYLDANSDIIGGTY